MSGKTILVVDDNPEIRKLLRALLQRDGHAVATAGDGAQALAYLRHQPPPALILLDLRMPGIDGWSFRAQQQADPRLASIPVVVFSAVAFGDETPDETGAVQVLRKPADVGQLRETVRRHV